MRLTSRLMLAMVALVMVTAGAVGWLAYQNIEAVVLSRAQARLGMQADLTASRLDSAVGNIRADVLGFRSAVALDGILRASLAGGTHPVDGTSFEVWRDRMASRFVAELQAKPLYSQFRIIGAADGGRELLRVDRSGPGAAIRIVPDAELGRKGGRPYFRETAKLAEGEVYVSPVDLNRENGEVEIPHVPTLRAATPIYGPGGELFGIVIINLNLGPVFAALRSDLPSMNKVFISNENGDYILHTDPALDFGFELGTPRNIRDDLPGLGDALQRSEFLAPRSTTDRNGTAIEIAGRKVRLAGGPPVGVVVVEPHAESLAGLRGVRDATLVGGVFAILGAMLLAAFMARSLGRPLAKMTTAVAAFAHGKPMSLPTRGGSHEIDELATAFTRMAAEIGEREAALSHNAGIFDIIMTRITDAVLLSDETGRIVFANPVARSLLGEAMYDELSEWRKTFSTFEPDGQTPILPEQWPLSRCLRGETVDNVELLFYASEQAEPAYLVVSGRPITGDDGASKGAVLTFRDVTEMKRVEVALGQAQRMDAIGQLTGGIAHDFNNILTVIGGNAELLADDLAAQPRQAAYVKSITRATGRAADLTSQLLAFARRQPLVPQVTNVNALITETRTLLQSTLGEHVEITSSLSKDVWPALVDPSQLSTALINLAVNARDAMPTGGKLTLETSNVELDEAYASTNIEVKPGAYVMVAVSDTGEGIPVAIRDKVFEPFFTTKEVGQGTGLGLSMVYGFVKQSEGHIKLYSEEGHGTTIKLYLPRAVSGAAAEPDAQPQNGPPRGNETILVVEDDDMVREHVVALVASLGYSTLSAANGAEAVALTDQGATFDLLFTDVIMPGAMSGRQVAEAISERRPGIRVLYTSGYTENAVVHHGRLDPGVSLLNKPYRRADLAAKLRDILDRPPPSA